MDAGTWWLVACGTRAIGLIVVTISKSAVVQHISRGRENSKAFLQENPDIAEEIEARIREELGMILPTLEEETDDAVASTDGKSENGKSKTVNAATTRG